MERFIADEVALLCPRAIALCHHDEWMPPIPLVDIEPILAEVRAGARVRIERSRSVTRSNLSRAYCPAARRRPRRR